MLLMMDYAVQLITINFMTLYFKWVDIWSDFKIILTYFDH